MKPQEFILLVNDIGWFTGSITTDYYVGSDHFGLLSCGICESQDVGCRRALLLLERNVLEVGMHILIALLVMSC
jgi:hypothetical protein